MKVGPPLRTRPDGPFSGLPEPLLHPGNRKIRNWQSNPWNLPAGARYPTAAPNRTYSSNLNALGTFLPLGIMSSLKLTVSDR